MHHAFTAPKPEFAGAIGSDPGTVLADAYDIVCNGHEIGGGSIRIHQRDIQEQVFDVMGIAAPRPPEKFGFLWTPSPLAHHRTAASRSAGTGSSRCSSARIRSAR